MKEKINTKVTKEELYKFCTDFGLMLSWGMPLTNVLIELEKSQENPFLSEISLVLYEKLIRGSSIGEILEKFHYVFKPVFLKWVKIGEKYGLLDAVLLQIAGLLRFDYILVKKISSVSSEELGRFLIQLAGFFKDKDPGRIIKMLPESRNLTNNPILIEWIEEIDTEKIFSDSQKNYLLKTIYRKIACPLFWHILDTAETCGYLPSMLEILGLYLTDKNNLIPSDEIITMEKGIFLEKENSLSLTDKILTNIEESKNKKLTLTIKKEEFTVSIDKREIDLASFLGLSSCDREILLSIVSSLKIRFDLDAVEKCLPQKIEKEYNKKYTVSIKITPPYSLSDKNLKPDEVREGTEIIEIALKGI